MTKNHYTTLGVERNADAEAIKKAYRKLAAQFHPDKNPGDLAAEERFKAIAEAYGVLGNDEKKTKYDQSTSFSSKYRTFNDLMNDGTVETFFYTARPNPPRGANIELTASISLEEVFHGVELTLSVTRNLACPMCDSTGAKSNKACDTCKGNGSVMSQDIRRIACPTCFGARVVPEILCTKCKGNGCYEGTQKVPIKIKRGIPENCTLTIPFQGHAGVRGGACGDLVLHINTLPHERFKRDGLDLFIDIDVNVTDLVLGGSVKIDSLIDTVEIKVPAGTQAEKQFRIKGKGLQTENTVGNLFATLKAIIPTHISEQQREHYEALRKIDQSIQF